MDNDEVSVTELPNGAYECAIMRWGFRVSRTYYGYDADQAVHLFLEYLQGREDGR